MHILSNRWFCLEGIGRSYFGIYRKFFFFVHLYEDGGRINWK